LHKQDSTIQQYSNNELSDDEDDVGDIDEVIHSKRQTSRQIEIDGSEGSNDEMEEGGARNVDDRSDQNTQSGGGQDTLNPTGDHYKSMSPSQHLSNDFQEI